jgi:hypothetical protein
MRGEAVAERKEAGDVVVEVEGELEPSAGGPVGVASGEGADPPAPRSMKLPSASALAPFADGVLASLRGPSR